MSKIPMFQGINLPEGLKAQIINNWVNLTVEQRNELIIQFPILTPAILQQYIYVLQDTSSIVVEMIDPSRDCIEVNFFAAAVTVVG